MADAPRKRVGAIASGDRRVLVERLVPAPQDEAAPHRRTKFRGDDRDGAPNRGPGANGVPAATTARCAAPADDVAPRGGAKAGLGDDGGRGRGFGRPGGRPEGGEGRGFGGNKSFGGRGEGRSFGVKAVVRCGGRSFEGRPAARGAPSAARAVVPAAAVARSRVAPAAKAGPSAVGTAASGQGRGPSGRRSFVREGAPVAAEGRSSGARAVRRRALVRGSLRRRRRPLVRGQARRLVLW